MAVQSFLQTIIYIISSSLLIPVMFFLVALICWILFQGGALFAEWIERKKIKKIVDINELIDKTVSYKIIPEEIFPYFTVNVVKYFKRLNEIIKNKDDEFIEVKVENLLQEKEIKMQKEVDKIKIVVRIGPSLGLMGTLIPMGTGLASFSSGDITKLSSSLIIAFTTTVVGLVIGSLAYFFAVVKERWIQEDMKSIELFTEIMMNLVNSD